MAFFRNGAVNLLNLHYALHAMAVAGGGAFILIHLVKSGLSPSLALASIASVVLGRFLIRPFLVGVAARFGLKRLLLLGTLVTALQYPLLAEVDGLGWTLAALIALSAVGDTIYWTSYHAYFAAVGDDEHRGQQVGMREAMTALISVASPLVTGLLLAGTGPRTAFGLSGVVTVLSALPLLAAPDVPVKPAAPSPLRAARRSITLFAADGWMAALYVMTWQISLYTSLGENVLAYGGALAASALAAAMSGLLLGRLIDGGHGRRAVFSTAAMFALVVIARAAAIGDASLAFAANAAGALVGAMYQPTLMTAVYADAKASSCAFRFQVATEGGWDIGAAAGLLTAAVLLHVGVASWVCIAATLAGIALHVAALHGYYGATRSS